MFVGIDLGTSAVKLILVNHLGIVQRIVSKSYPLYMPKEGWTEQDPKVWFEQTLEGLKELVKGFESYIEGIGFSGQMHGLVLLGENDVILRRAILWNDQRTTNEVDLLNNDLKTLLDETGNIAITGLTAPKILWVKKHEPELFKNIKKIMLPKDYLIYKLSGVFASDTSDASGTLYVDVAHRCYSQRMLKLLDIKEEQCPKLFESYEVIGTLKQIFQEQLGLKKQVKMTCGGGDQAMGAVGVGVVKNGQCSVSLGTSGVVFVANDTFHIDKKSYLQSYCHANGKYLMMGVMLNAGGAHKWWYKNILNETDYNLYYDSLSLAKETENLYFLPYLNGERSPINDPEASGAFFGLKHHHQTADLNRAVLEGITFGLKQSFDLIESLQGNIETIRVTGGGAKNIAWARLIANVFNRNVERVEIEEGPAFGAAITAMVGCNKYKSVSDACAKIVQIKDSFLPQTDKVALYKKKYKNFTQIYPQIKNIHIERLI